MTKPAILKAIKKGLLNAIYVDRPGSQIGMWLILYEDLENYRWKRKGESHILINDTPLYDQKKGRYSVKQAALMLGIDRQHIYYLIRQGIIYVERSGKFIVMPYSQIKKIAYFYQIEKKFENVQLKFA